MDEKTVTVTTPQCFRCGKTGTLEVPQRVLDAWQNGKGDFIQVAWPDGTPDQREQLMTGIHGKCYDEMFPPDEEF